MMFLAGLRRAWCELWGHRWIGVSATNNAIECSTCGRRSYDTTRSGGWG